MASVMGSLAVMTRFPPASCTYTLMAGEIATVETVLEGSTLKASWAGGPGVTVKAALVPVSRVTGLVAVMVKLPTFDIVTLWEESTPLVKAAVAPPPAESVPVEVMSTVPVKPV